MGQHLLRFAAQEKTGDSAAAVRCHHNQIAVLLAGDADDGFVGRVAGDECRLRYHAIGCGDLQGGVEQLALFVFDLLHHYFSAEVA